jgi:PhnB protein
MTMTRQHLVPYINFQSRAREATEFYQRVLGGTLQMYAGGEQGQPRPAEPGDRIMYARLEADGLVIVASDGHPSYPATVGDHIGLQIGGTDEAWLKAVFDGLAEGGQVGMPLTKQPWGTSGWLTDRFGINWNVDIEAG